MTEETTPQPGGEPRAHATSENPDPPTREELSANETSRTPDPPRDSGSGGIGLGAGIVVGASVGVLLAVVAAMWFGIQRSSPGNDSIGLDSAAPSGDTRPGEPTPERPATGTDIVPPARTGGGTLILQNIGDLDTVVVLADETTYSRAVYVRSGERVTIPNVAAGTFEVLMMLGRNWRAGRFTQAAAYQQLDRAIEFTERDVGSSTEYTQLTVSVEPLTAGLLGMRATEPFQLTTP
jgi:hypothetical protein